MMNFTLRQLRIFEAVARHLSYTHAAQELHLTQPAVSMQIKQLEELVGLPLLEQIGKRTFLTQAGQEMYHYCRTIASQVDEARMVLNEMKGLKHGRLNITVASTANYFIPKILASFCARYPGVTVNLDVTNREVLLKKLESNETDLAIMGQPPPELPLKASAFMTNPLVIIAAPDHRLAGKSRIPLAALKDETFIMREEGSGTRIATERFFAERGVTLTSHMEMSSNEGIKQAVQAGLGLGLLSVHTLEMELQLKRLVILMVAGFPIPRNWYAVHAEGKRFSTVAQAFLDFIIKESPKLIKPPVM